MQTCSKNISSSPERAGQICALTLLLAAIGASAPKALAQSAPVKLCVAMVQNTSNYSVDTRNQQTRLVQQFNTAKKDKKGKLATVEAVPLRGQTPEEAGSEARDQGCGYVLYTNVTTLRAPSDAQQQPYPSTRPGTISIGRDPISAYPQGNDPVFEAQVDFKLYKVDPPDPVLASSAQAIEHTGEDGAVSATFDVVVNRIRGALAHH